MKLLFVEITDIIYGSFILSRIIATAHLTRLVFGILVLVLRLVEMIWLLLCYFHFFSGKQLTITIKHFLYLLNLDF